MSWRESDDLIHYSPSGSDAKYFSDNLIRVEVMPFLSLLKGWIIPCSISEFILAYE